MAAPGLQIDLQRHSLGVGEIFLHGWNDLETAVPEAVGRFSSFSIFFVEKWQKRTIFVMTRPSRFEFKIQITQNWDGGILFPPGSRSISVEFHIKAAVSGESHGSVFS